MKEPPEWVVGAGLVATVLGSLVTVPSMLVGFIVGRGARSAIWSGPVVAWVAAFSTLVVMGHREPDPEPLDEEWLAAQRAYNDRINEGRHRFCDHDLGLCLEHGISGDC